MFVRFRWQTALTDLRVPGGGASRKPAPWNQNMKNQMKGKIMKKLLTILTLAVAAIAVTIVATLSTNDSARVAAFPNGH
jgi:hypothetical protein